MPEPLQSYLKVQVSSDRKTRSILERTAEDLRRRIRFLHVTPGVGARIRAAQLQLVLSNLEGALVEQLGTVVHAGTVEAAEAAVKAASVLDGVLFRSIGEEAAQVILKSLEATAQRGLVTDAGRIRRELSPRVYTNYERTREAIEQTIRSGLISGLSPRELARSVYEFVSPTTPGGASYASLRLARTEINNAFHQQQIRSAKKPWVEYAIWNLSGSHKRPDQCNIYASQRRFKPESVPGKPHPQCLCYLTYDTDSPEAFIRKFTEGKYDEWINDQPGVKLTTTKRKREIVSEPPRSSSDG